MTLSIPESPTALAAADLLREAAAPFLVNHSYRTYAFGLLVSPPDVDHEAAFVAAMLHDLGLTDAHRGADEFAPVGAEIAARFLTGRGWESDRIRLVEQAIVRHTELTEQGEPTARVVQAGARIDVIGHGADHLDPATIVEILAAYPRLDFVTSMRALYLDELDRHPDGAFATLEHTVRLSTRFDDNPIDRVLA